ncbi:MAG: hypothetical protein K6A14_07290 [Erysipelotrichaceae bacterium]|nr:hypothetical protein [Erysipelotrichaceae bacterium]
MSKGKVYEVIGSGSVDDWMERERRYEARHSPWDLDDNASYLDEEHRRHCEARELRKHHEQNCEVPHPDYSKYEQRTAENQFVSPAQQFQELRKRLRNNVRAASPQASAAGKSAALFFAIVILIFFMFFVSMFIQILLRF